MIRSTSSVAPLVRRWSSPFCYGSRSRAGLAASTDTVGISRLVRSFGAGASLAIILLLPTMLPASEFDLEWTAGDHDWFDAQNWEDPDLPANDPDKHRVPTASDDAAVNNGGTANIDSGAATARSLVLGDDGSGSIVQTGGSATFSSLLKLADEAGSSGSYRLTDGTLSTTLSEIGNGGTGVFTQDGGTHAGGQLVLGAMGGSMGTYELNAGSFSTLPPMGLAGTIVGGVGTGRFIHVGGDHHVTATLEIGRVAGGFGRYEMSGGTLTVDLEGFGVGVFGEGEFDHTDGTVTANVPLFVGFGPGSVGTYTQDGGTVAANVRLVVGRFGGSDGTYNYNDGDLTTKDVYVGRWGEGLFEHGETQRLPVDGDMYIGYGSSGKGTYRLDPDGVIEINGTIHVSRTTWDAGPPYPEGRFEMDMGTITTLAGANDEPRMFAHGANARILGAGVYDAFVTFESDPVYGENNDQPMWIGFDRNSLTQGSTFKVEDGLTNDHSGSTENTDVLQAQMLPDTSLHVEWGDAGDSVDPGNVDYVLTPEGTKKPEIAIPYDPADVVGNEQVSKDNIEKRLRMWKFREGKITNISDMNDDKSPRVDTDEHVVYGRAKEVRNGDAPKGFDLGTGGLAVDPKHQDSNIAALHELDLTGEGVKMGQIEPDIPYEDHGAFMDWDNADASKLRLTVDQEDADFNGHPTWVASIMVGYDPLGVQVGSDQKLQAEDKRYNDGFGFVGVAPKAKLWSRSAPGEDEVIDAIAHLVITDGVKIINKSAVAPTDPSKPNGPDGSGDDELTLDFYTGDYHEHAVLVDGRGAWAIREKGVIFAQTAGNDGRNSLYSLRSPAGAYNAIVVGAVQMDKNGTKEYPTKFDAANAVLWDGSSLGPTGDERVGVDILAQGVANLLAFAEQDPISLDEENVIPRRGLYSTKAPNSGVLDGTSFAAPTVAGVAALLVEAADDMGSETAKSPLVIKSVLQTSADKLAGWRKGDTTEDDDHLIPLDFGQGAGLMDPIGAHTLLTGGEFEDGPTAVPISGWDWDILFDDDESDFGELDGHVYLLEIPTASLLTATLNWYRHIEQLGSEAFSAQALTNLDLEVHAWDGTVATLVDQSISGAVDGTGATTASNNVEHFYQTSLAVGDHLLRVYGSTFGDRTYEEYAVSWDVVPIPEPATLVLLAIGGLALAAVALARRRRRK